MAPASRTPVQEGMQTLASWTLLVYGATLIVTGSRLTEPLRTWLARVWPWLGKLVSCPMCFGWWVGAGVWAVLPNLSPVPGSWFIAAPANAFCSSAVCWILHVVLARMGADDL